MSGHSKWATTKHKKAAVDARRGKLFAKPGSGVRRINAIDSANARCRTQPALAWLNQLPARTIFTATSFSNSPSARSARYTVPIPPRPICRSSR